MYEGTGNQRGSASQPQCRRTGILLGIFAIHLVACAPPEQTSPGEDLAPHALAAGAPAPGLAQLGAEQDEAGPAGEEIDRSALIPLRENRQASDGTVRVYTLDPVELNAARHDSDLGTVLHDGSTERVHAFIDSQMQKGIVRATSEVDTAAFDIPGVGALYLVQDRHDSIVRLVAYVSELPAEDGSIEPSEVSFDVGWLADPEASTDPQTRSPGFDAGSSATATRRGSGSRTVYFNPGYASQNNVDHWVTTNWEKWQSKKGSRDWGYNRYATFDPANGGVWSTGKLGYSRGEIVDATIRSKPWKGYESRIIKGPLDYEPRPSERCANVATLSVNLGEYATVQLPVANCYSGSEIYPNGNAHSMGTAWYGHTTAQRYLDFAYSFTTNGNTPVLADYVWMTVRHCWVPHKSLSCSGLPSLTQNYKWTDSGW